MSVVLSRSDIPLAPAKSVRGRILFLVDAVRTIEQQVPMLCALDAAGWETWFMPLSGAGNIGTPPPEFSRIWPLVPAAAASGADAHVHPSRKPGGGLRSRLGRLLQLRGLTALRELVLAVLMARAWRRQRAAARRRIAALAPRCIITAQERTPDALPVVAAAKDLGIPVILVVSAGLYMPDGGAYMRRNDPALRLDPGVGTSWTQLLLNRFVGWVQPGHVFASRWGRMLHQPAHWYMATWLAHLSLPNFWFQGTRFVDAVVISGDDERRVCEIAGIPPARIAAIGSPALQLQYERRQERSRVRAELGLSRTDALIVVSLPPLWEHNLLDQATHFAFTDRLLAQLSNHEATVIVSLHPKMDRRLYAARIEAAGLRMAERPISTYLPAADLFIAGIYSSTIRWAMAVGIPSVNLDFWEFNELTYAGVADYVTLKSFKALQRWLDARLAGGSPKPHDGALPLGLICDGRFGERFVELVERLAGSPKR